MPYFSLGMYYLLPFLVLGLAHISHTFSEQIAALPIEIASQMSEAVLHEHCPRPFERQSQSAERRSVQRKCEKCGPAACSSKDQKVCKQRLSGNYVFRLHDEYFFKPSPPLPHSHPSYPWEDKYIGKYPHITKEFFRCKGNPLNPVVIQTTAGKEPNKYFDCQGGRKHGLPLRDGQEFIYPCLLELLNYLQQQTDQRVIITCGHRCPEHNLYADHKSENWGSKHTIGAEVDFYIEGMENEPQALIPLIEQYYSKTFPNQSDYICFQRFEKGGLNVSTPPWFNKEIFIKLYLAHEGRDCDNQHPYPYLGIQVRTDRASSTKVSYDPKQAQNYLRY
jgi:hypothetical protein